MKLSELTQRYGSEHSVELGEIFGPITECGETEDGYYYCCWEGGWFWDVDLVVSGTFGRKKNIEIGKMYRFSEKESKIYGKRVAITRLQEVAI